MEWKQKKEGAHTFCITLVEFGLQDEIYRFEARIRIPTHFTCVDEHRERAGESNAPLFAFRHIGFPNETSVWNFSSTFNIQFEGEKVTTVHSNSNTATNQQKEEASNLQLINIKIEQSELKLIRGKKRIRFSPSTKWMHEYQSINTLNVRQYYRG